MYFLFNIYGIEYIIIRLPNMAKNLEEHLYRNGHSKEGYMNTETLKFRLQQMGIGVFAKQK